MSRYRRCATPGCGVRHSTHFRVPSPREAYYAKCDRCRDAIPPRCSCGCGRAVRKTADHHWRKTATAACHRWQLRRGGRIASAPRVERRLRFIATHGTLPQRLAALAELGRRERVRQLVVERVGAPAGREVAA